MALDITSLKVRALSGIVYVALLVTALLLSTDILFLLLFIFMGASMIIEFNRLTQINRLHPFRTVFDIVATSWGLYATSLYFSGTEGIQVFIPYFLYIVYAFSRTIFADLAQGIKTVGNVLTAQAYVALPLFITTAVSYQMDGSFDGTFALLVFVLIWINDTGAYLVGSTMGKHKLYPQVSPKKSVEGLLGGLVLTIVVSLFIPSLLPSLGKFDMFTASIFAFVVAAMGTMGDFFESALKRKAGVKDSGKIIPGHGGMLDRLDSYLFALPMAAMLYFLLF
ncbi:phosphatidate cytidylyltransferase [Porphyromonas circumdentaria]|uniref:Phosphatidate cytidylyltransferase n=1 Tax=Porphyromonas circumdentaria TaxID=29524 RepID=A0A1T4KM16_9PORP|nr:phosphatidate cytidylyltransferase [Porphyromonas circumdentaria]MBB6274988.1 phosphatidate cytidylyltransferase [Porphyromonas circumdentaria]MDO4722197.1 phosphatidate cytidylyltransferase [Porphyromonas circumdentaria]SJZ43428.1 phosphatidate cytidylyltransferase [Porphyromonas circumdentaria]